MTRMARLVTLISLVAGLVAATPAFAQASPQNSRQKRQSKPAPQWEKLGEGARVVRLWRTSLGPARPQVAVLELEAEEYKKFAADPTQYLEKYEVFGKVRLNGVVSAVDLTVTEPGRSKKLANDPPVGGCTVLVSHTSWCTAASIAACY